MDNVNQIRAQIAFDEIAQLSASQHKDFKSLASNLPAMVQQNGLIATWAFLLAKNKDQHQSILNLLMAHYRANVSFLNIPDGLSARDFYLTQLIDENSQASKRLMELTAETIAFSGWIKRAAEALCTGGN
ncbi:MAG: type III-B CRISPR module-associated protein Cmr5 [Methanobacteriota archaeon]|nr:MAG: type III-B CRISPR module-associated protein Cmr5 [Euryarchaeota archaeon]